MHIDRDVPMPAQKGKQKKQLPPVEHMQIGDSIFFAGLNRQSAMGKCRIAAILSHVKFNFRSAPDGDGTRVWRIA